MHVVLSKHKPVSETYRIWHKH